MSLIKYIKRLEYMDFLISTESTGSPEEFAGKIGIKRSTLLDHIKELRLTGIEINYSHTRRTYYYSNGKEIKDKLNGLPLRTKDLDNCTGGTYLNNNIQTKTSPQFYMQFFKISAYEVFI